MATPEFILALREKIGTDSLWLSGVSAVVDRQREGRTEILLVRRADSGRWANVGGIIEPGEEPADAVEREVLEEAGIVVVAEHLAWVHTLPPTQWANGDRAQFLDLVFRCRWVSGEPHPADGENLEARWFAVDDLPVLPESHQARLRVALAGEQATRFERTSPENR